MIGPGGVGDYDDPGNVDWTSGMSIFGACLEGKNANATNVWALDGNGTCTTSDLDPWNGVPTTSGSAGAAVADSASTLVATVSLRFGMYGASGLAPGNYSAPVVFEVVAPAVNSSPTAPTLVSPSSAQVVATTTPSLVATFNDLNPGDSGTITFEVCTAAFVPAQTCAAAGGVLAAGGNSAGGITPGNNGSWVVSPALTVGTTYYWRARGTDAAASNSPYSAARSFTVNSAPTTPSYVSPAAGAIVASTTPTLTASFNDPDAGDTGQINFRLDTAAGCDATPTQTGSSATGVAIGANGSWAVGSALTAGTTYHWCVQGRDANGQTSGWTTSRSFTVNSAPTTPTALAPAGGASVGSLTPTLQATFQDPNTGDAGQINFRLDTAAGCDATPTQSGSSSTGLIIGTSGIWTVPSALTLGATYHWCVQGQDANGLTGPWSASQSFVVGSPPTLPTRVSPLNGAFPGPNPSLTATFNDPDAGDTGRINFRLDNTSGCDATPLRSGSSASGLSVGANGTWTPTALPNGTYYWCAQGQEASGATSSWTTSWSITVTVFLESYTAVTTSASSPLTIAKPAGTQVGDVLVGCAVSSNGGAISGPAGWTTIASVAAVGGNPRIHGAYRVVDGSEGATFEWTTGAVGMAGSIARYSGVDTASVLDATTIGVGGASASNTGTSFDALSTTSANAMLIGCVGINSGTQAITATPTGMTEVWESTGTRIHEYAHGVQPVAGASGAKQWTFAAGREWAGWLTALKPA